MGKIGKLLNELISTEGFSPSNVSGVSFFKSSTSTYCDPNMYQPCIVIVGQGKKIGKLAEESFSYDVENFLVLTIPMAYECEIVIQSGEAFLAFIVDINTTMLHEIIGQMDHHLKIKENDKNKIQN